MSMNINWIFNHLDITVQTGNPNTHQQSQFIIGGTTADNTLTVTIANKSDDDFTLTASQCLTVDLSEFISASDIEQITMSNAPSDLNHITFSDAASGWQMKAYAVPTGQGSNTVELLCISDPSGLTVAAQQTVSFSLTNITVTTAPVPPTNNTTGKIDIFVYDTEGTGGKPTTAAVLMPLSLIFYKYPLGAGDPTPVNAEDFDEYVGDLYVFGVKSSDKNTGATVEITPPNQRDYKLNYTGDELTWTAGNEPEIQVNFSAGSTPQAGNISTINALTNFSLTVNESAQQYWTVGKDLGAKVPSLYVKAAPGITSIPSSAFPLTLSIDYGELYLDDTLVSGSDLPQTTISMAFTNFNSYSPVTLPINIYTNNAPYIASFECTPDWTMVSPGPFTLSWNVLNDPLGPIFQDNPNVKIAATGTKTYSLTADKNKTLVASTVKPPFQMTQKVSMAVIPCTVNALECSNPWQFDFDNDLVVDLKVKDLGQGEYWSTLTITNIATGAVLSSDNQPGLMDCQIGQGVNGYLPLMLFASGLGGGSNQTILATYFEPSAAVPNEFPTTTNIFTNAYFGGSILQTASYFPYPSRMVATAGGKLFYCFNEGGNFFYGDTTVSGPSGPTSPIFASQVNYFDTDLSSDQNYIVSTGRSVANGELQWTLYDISANTALNSVGLNVAGFGATNALIKGDTLVSASGLTVSSIPLSTAANPTATPILTLDASVCSSITLVTVCTSSSGTDYWIMATDNNKMVVWSEGDVIYEVPYSSAITRLESDRVSKVVTSYAPGVTRYKFGW